MRKLPDITDDAAMASRGRHSVLMSARNDACEELRDIFVRAQAAQMGELAQHADGLAAVAQRLVEIEALWKSLKESEG